MLGHLDVVEAILARKAELAREQDYQSSTPLHLAAAKGYLDIVESLVRVSPETRFVHDKYKRNPLHVTVMKGRVDVLECLVQATHDVYERYQFINSRDEDGNTILHLAASNGQIEINRCKKHGYRSKREEKRKWQNDMHKMLMVAAALVAIIAYEAGREPPKAPPKAPPDMEWLYKVFMAFNTISFMASLSTIMLLICDLPLKQRRITMWIAMLSVWVAITFTALSYSILMVQVLWATDPLVKGREGVGSWCWSKRGEEWLQVKEALAKRADSEQTWRRS
ncbi:ankyrin repeat-containing protein NPR4-like [Eucalyptus grandis]|uniref:ankyrin repeat-containing protein NPR4-like n=1 Tax=Eucalyptus grandis TaxID=71139 RepID=UPI00192EEA41|nr:ankyrin repeat-containing protein NPR4-like [Eucalyptus grandis]